MMLGDGVVLYLVSGTKKSAEIVYPGLLEPLPTKVGGKFDSVRLKLFVHGKLGGLQSKPSSFSSA